MIKESLNISEQPQLGSRCLGLWGGLGHREDAAGGEADRWQTGAAARAVMLSSGQTPPEAQGSLSLKTPEAERPGEGTWDVLGALRPLMPGTGGLKLQRPTGNWPGRRKTPWGSHGFSPPPI